MCGGGGGGMPGLLSQVITTQSSESWAQQVKNLLNTVTPIHSSEISLA